MNKELAQNLPIVTMVDGNQGVLARHLHQMVENKRQFMDWFKQRCTQGGFIEGEDYLLHKIVKQTNGPGGHNQINPILTINTAKHFAMMEKNEKGKEIRQYFIDVEQAGRRLFAELMEARQIPQPPTEKRMPVAKKEEAADAFIRTILTIEDAELRVRLYDAFMTYTRANQ